MKLRHAMLPLSLAQKFSEGIKLEDSALLTFIGDFLIEAIGQEKEYKSGGFPFCQTLCCDKIL